MHGQSKGSLLRFWGCHKVMSSETVYVVVCRLQGPLPLTTWWRWPPPLTLTPRALPTTTRRRLWLTAWLPSPQPQPSTQVG
jgi:hypothetical protein